MKLTKREMETIIVWNEADDEMSISTYNEKLANKLQASGLKPTRVELFNRGTVGYEFECSKTLLKIGLKRVLSDEERLKHAESLKKARAAQNKKSSD